MVNRQILSDWVCGEAVATVPHESLYLQDPNTGSSLEPMASARPESIEAALERAVEIHRTGLWWKRDRAERANVLDQIANGLEGRTQAIAEIAAARTGVVITQTDRFARLIPKIFRNAAQLIRGAAVIVWDEASTASKSMYEAVDQCLRELLDDPRPWGGNLSGGIGLRTCSGLLPASRLQRKLSAREARAVFLVYIYIYIVFFYIKIMFLI